jgi:hypothetical protein
MTNRDESRFLLGEGAMVQCLQEQLFIEEVMVCCRLPRWLAAAAHAKFFNSKMPWSLDISCPAVLSSPLLSSPL